MIKHCPNCGAPLLKVSNFSPCCGASLKDYQLDWESSPSSTVHTTDAIPAVLNACGSSTNFSETAKTDVVADKWYAKEGDVIKGPFDKDDSSEVVKYILGSELIKQGITNFSGSASKTKQPTYKGIDIESWSEVQLLGDKSGDNRKPHTVFYTRANKQGEFFCRSVSNVSLNDAIQKLHKVIDEKIQKGTTNFSGSDIKVGDVSPTAPVPTPVPAKVETVPVITTPVVVDKFYLRNKDGKITGPFNSKEDADKAVGSGTDIKVVPGKELIDGGVVNFSGTEDKPTPAPTPTAAASGSPPISEATPVNKSLTFDDVLSLAKKLSPDDLAKLLLAISPESAKTAMIAAIVAPAVTEAVTKSTETTVPPANPGEGKTNEKPEDLDDKKTVLKNFSGSKSELVQSGTDAYLSIMNQVMQIQ